MKGEPTKMTKIAALMLAFGLALGASVGAAQERGEGGEGGEGGAEHGGEEAATQYGLNDVYDVVRSGARLILRYDAASESFVGSVTNTTAAILRNVRIEIHLSNGTELGPTTPIDLAPGASIPVELPSPGESFMTWGAHPEVG